MTKFNVFAKNNLKILYDLLYLGGTEFISDLARDIKKSYMDIDEAKNITILIIKNSILLEKIYVESNLGDIKNNVLLQNNIIYDNENVNDLIKIIDNHFDKFTDINNDQIKYSFLIHYTETWTKTLGYS